MKQKDIYVANLNPTMGNEQEGFRPVVIIGGNTMNDNFGVVMACPLTTKIRKFTGCLVLEKNQTNGLNQNSELLTFQLRAISKERLTKKIGIITDEELEKVKLYLNEIITY